jgi:aspartate racemase
LVPLADDRPVPLSFTQGRIWYLQQLDPQATSYNIPLAWQIDGDLDAECLQKAVNEIVRRHEVLRTSFVMTDKEPVQIVAAEAQVDMTVTELSSANGCGVDKAQELVEADARRPFDLQNGPLLRAMLLRLTPSRHVFCLCFHHTVFDGGSLGVLQSELTVLYQAFVNEQSSPLAPLPVQYRDYSEWQRAWLEGGEIERQLTYWSEALSGELPVLELPTDHPRPSLHRYDGAVVIAEISGKQLAALDLIAREQKATRFMVLLAVFNALLSRICGQGDIIVGSPIANRQLPETAGMIGFFANTLALRTRLSATDSFSELVARVRDACLGGYAHQDLPFERLVEEINPARDTSRTPLFQVLFAFQESVAGQIETGDISLQPLPASGNAQTDLSLWVESQPDRLVCALEYCKTLFEPATIQSWLDSFMELLGAVGESPETRIGALSMLAGDERHRQLVSWNETERSYPNESIVAYLQRGFAAPAAEALVMDDVRLSYAELDSRSNRLAHYLRSQGAGQGELVGLSLERSTDMVVTLLGILKSGAAYLPLDPGFPSERLEFMLEDSGTQLLVTQSDLLSALPAFAGTTVCLDRDAEVIDAQVEEPLAQLVGPEDRAYVIYTSGSTGKQIGRASCRERV